MDWIKSNEGRNTVNFDRQRDLSSNLASFTKATTFQSGVCSILANLMTKSSDLTELRNLFTQWDVNNDGELSFDELKQNMAEM